jgi:hypothetical protein
VDGVKYIAEGWSRKIARIVTWMRAGDDLGKISERSLTRVLGMSFSTLLTLHTTTHEEKQRMKQGKEE